MLSINHYIVTIINHIHKHCIIWQSECVCVMKLLFLAVEPQALSKAKNVQTGNY